MAAGKRRIAAAAAALALGALACTLGMGSSGTIGGTVWLDYCSPGDAEGGTGPDAGTCVIDSFGAKAADGVMQPEEEGLEGVTVSLWEGTCPPNGEPGEQAVTGSDGEYTFTALTPGQYCVGIRVLEDGNDAVLIPGAFTAPPSTVDAMANVNVSAGTDTVQNFGWDFQLD